jgi:DNA-binding transcriptional LysR family regulator
MFPIKFDHRQKPGRNAVGRRLPPLNALRAFDTAARTSSFTAAAQELHVSPGAVSRHVSQLEAYLGVALFRRDHGGTRLTPIGADYARAIGNAFDDVEHATRRAGPWQTVADQVISVGCDEMADHPTGRVSRASSGHGSQHHHHAEAGAF